MKEADQKDYENSGHVISLIKKDDKPESKKFYLNHIEILKIITLGTRNQE